MPLLVAIVFLCVIFAAGLWWLAGDVSDSKMSHVAEFGLLLFDSLLAMVILILGVGGVFGYQFLKKWVEDEARKRTEEHLKSDELFDKRVKEAVERHIETDAFKTKLQKAMAQQGDAVGRETESPSNEGGQG